MGSDKALLSLGGQTLLQRTLEVAGAVTDPVHIVGRIDQYAAFGEVVEDIYRDCGPLGGIHAALLATRTDLNLILSVDMPLMSSDFLGWLVQKATMSDAMIVVPNAAGGLQPLCAIYRRGVAEPAEQALIVVPYAVGRLQPLCAIYRRGVAEPAEQALRAGDYKIDRLFSRVPTRVLHEQEIIASGFSPDTFRNINTPEEYEQCRRA
jgi:molybdopterin-guanine dinucleotide biosynthesis protein A